ncbi:MAG: (deoxy)nucleoside triphosphate pyrophosphohydrolase [Daejeonella sp.]|uniref:(deoxy)nucleoside triphosphate pyrophosphohydrolase n=1 Tax=Daejeonella sp. TaxID=2805397 RepID=UPI00273761C6|nr:(deoxy)nucleoside triphosphate pyrophosphohydrolase [Daejeonella sp.]MDP3466779.1 (deoxy)nucleoside triphosphate pyrophosphohydrolase [Daejeonella sp.]
MIQVSCAIIINPFDQVLVTQRSALMPLPLKWEFPGGKIEENETAEACLIREIKEELNIDIQITGSLPPNDHQYPDKLIRLIPFICQQTGGETVLKEHADYKWLDAKDLLDLDWAEADVPIVKRYLNR